MEHYLPIAVLRGLAQEDLQQLVSGSRDTTGPKSKAIPEFPGIIAKKADFDALLQIHEYILPEQI